MDFDRRSRERIVTFLAQISRRIDGAHRLFLEETIASRGAQLLQPRTTEDPRRRKIVTTRTAEDLTPKSVHAGLSIVTFRPGRPDYLVFPPHLALRADEQAFPGFGLRLLAVPIHFCFAQIFDVQCSFDAEIDISAGRPSYNVQRSDDFVAFWR